MRVTPICYSADIAASGRFYEALGLERDASSQPGAWVELARRPVCSRHTPRTNRNGDGGAFGLDLAVRAVDQVLAERR